MSDHSCGHSDSCHWCGYNPDVDPQRPCDERLHKKPSAATMAEVDRREEITRCIEAEFFEYVYSGGDPAKAFEALLVRIRACEPLLNKSQETK